MKCEICLKGPPIDDVVLFRVNEKGVKGIWRCSRHLTAEQANALDPEVVRITHIIQSNGKET